MQSSIYTQIPFLLTVFLFPTRSVNCNRKLRVRRYATSHPPTHTHTYIYTPTHAYIYIYIHIHTHTHTRSTSFSVCAWLSALTHSAGAGEPATRRRTYGLLGSDTEYSGTCLSSPRKLWECVAHSLCPLDRAVRRWLTSEGGTLKTTSAEGSGVERPLSRKLKRESLQLWFWFETFEWLLWSVNPFMCVIEPGFILWLGFWRCVSECRTCE
jgi:hypothetical protein